MAHTQMVLNYKRIALFFALPVLLLPLVTGCMSSTMKGYRLPLTKETLDDYGITFHIPGGWFLTQDTYFHLKAFGFAPNNLPASLEYRGLDNKRVMDAHNKEQYANGWYQAISSNYPDWKFDFKRKIVGDPEGSFEFEGTYRVATDVYRRIGKLRFRGRRVHAIYYTGLDQNFEKARDFFEKMDKSIEYAE